MTTLIFFLLQKKTMFLYLLLRIYLAWHY